MGERIATTEHKGKKIAVLDLTGLKPAEIAAALSEFGEFVVAERCTRLLVDITSTHITPEVEQAVAATRALVGACLGKTTTALVGAQGVQRLLANSMEEGQYFAASREDGLDHLASKP